MSIFRRKQPTKWLGVQAVTKEYNVTSDDLLSLLKSGYLEAQGIFNNDYSHAVERDRGRYQIIPEETWQGRYGWEYDVVNCQLQNQEDLQAYTNLRFLRKHLEDVIYLAPKSDTPLYNWRIIFLQTFVHFKDKPLPPTKDEWFRQILENIPYFKTGSHPDYKTMDKHLGIAWNALNSKEVNWHQYLR
jgi:hypothetical protein